MNAARKALPNYLRVLAGLRSANFLSCGSLGEKAEAAGKILSSCRLCERRCGVDRGAGERGFCGVLEPRITSRFLHYGEEAELVPSHTVFFAGCTFSCVFCQNWDISQNPRRGQVVEPQVLAELIDSVPARNVNWVGGDPTPNIPFMLDTLTQVKKSVPQVFNSNMYLTGEAMSLLDGVADVYLADFKYGPQDCAVKYSSAPDYFKVVSRNILEAGRQAELIIRHLVLPSHFECCTKPVLEWVSENTPQARVNIMDQYRPEYKAREHPEIAEKLSHSGYMEARDYGKKLGLNLV